MFSFQLEEVTPKTVEALKELLASLQAVHGHRSWWSPPFDQEVSGVEVLMHEHIPQLNKFKQEPPDTGAEDEGGEGGERFIIADHGAAGRKMAMRMGLLDFPAS